MSAQIKPQKKKMPATGADYAAIVPAPAGLLQEATRPTVRNATMENARAVKDRENVQNVMEKVRYNNSSSMAVFRQDSQSERGLSQSDEKEFMVRLSVIRSYGRGC